MRHVLRKKQAVRNRQRYDMMNVQQRRCAKRKVRARLNKERAKRCTYGNNPEVTCSGQHTLGWLSGAVMDTLQLLDLGFDGSSVASGRENLSERRWQPASGSGQS